MMAVINRTRNERIVDARAKKSLFVYYDFNSY
jgi:hypothetical protein